MSACAQELRDDLIKLESTAKLRQEVQRPLCSDAPAGHGHWPRLTAAAEPSGRVSAGVSAPANPPAPCHAAGVTDCSAAVVAGCGAAGKTCSSISAAFAQREPQTGADAVTYPSETMIPQPEKRRSFRPVVSVKRALERLRARSVTPPAGDDVGAATHPQPAAAAIGSPCTIANAAALSSTPKSDPGLHERGPQPPMAAPGVQSEPAQGPCRRRRPDADVSAKSGAALPERTHVSDTPARTSDARPCQHGASILRKSMQAY